MLVASSITSASPPISAATVSRLMKKDAPRFTNAHRAPSRSRTMSNTGRFDIVATRPAISA